MIERENPARPDEIVGAVRVTDPAEVDSVVRRAGEAFLEWSRLPPAGRLAALAASADALAARKDALAVLLARESGKPVGDCRGEIGFAVSYLRWLCERAPGVLASREVDDGAGRLAVRRAPYGVVAAVTPWNAPVILAVLKLGPALAAGNTVVLKPSPLAPLAVTEAAGLFPGTSVVHGGPETVRELVGHPLVRKVAFTGGAAAGREIAAAAGRGGKPVLLELGGNDPAVFLPDFALTEADFERLVMASFATSGQVCMAAKRLYVPRHRAGDFVDAYVAAARRVLVTGDPLDPGVTMGPVVSAEAARRLEALAEDSVRRGGTAVPLGTWAARRTRDPAAAIVSGRGGDSGYGHGGYGHDEYGRDEYAHSGYFVAPRLVLGLADDAPLVAGEQFGPLVPLLPYDDEDEALARANACELGLGASVWSADEERAFAFAARLEAGFTFVNTHNRTGMSLRAPFGGTKQSGYGREYADEGLLEYVQSAVVHAPAAFRPGGPGMPAGAYPG
nr:aldehyde dehydrogenase family protein [Planomonospora venezuelensis]